MPAEAAPQLESRPADTASRAQEIEGVVILLDEVTELESQGTPLISRRFSADEVEPGLENSGEIIGGTFDTDGVVSHEVRIQFPNADEVRPFALEVASQDEALEVVTDPETAAHWIISAAYVSAAKDFADTYELRDRPEPEYA